MCFHVHCTELCLESCQKGYYGYREKTIGTKKHDFKHKQSFVLGGQGIIMENNVKE